MLRSVRQRETKKSAERNGEEMRSPSPGLKAQEERLPQKEEKEIVEVDNHLREYQRTAIQTILDKWSTQRNIMLQMPTGTGKTRLFVALISALTATKARSFGIERQPYFLVVTHREEIVEQISGTLFSHYKLSHIILGSKKCKVSDVNQKEIPVSVSSIQYLSRHIKDISKEENYDFIIIDEAHHSLAASYRLLWQAYPDAFKLGVTATPYRLCGQGFRELYQELVTSRGVEYFIKQGYLADYRFFTVSREQAALQKVNRLTKVNAFGDYRIKDLQEIYAGDEEMEFLYDCYKTHVNGKQGIIYAVNHLHAEMIARYFADNGVNIASIDSRTSAGKRQVLIDKFRKGMLQVLVNVELFTEGFDCPAIGFVMLARPTKSLAMYLQQVGRALRPDSSKKEADDKVFILDCAGLYNRFGLPERPRDWEADFCGLTVESETYTAPLGMDSDSPGLLEIETPRVMAERERLKQEQEGRVEIFSEKGLYGIRNIFMSVRLQPCCVELKRTSDGWFYGKDKEGRLVIADRRGEPVFTRRNSEMELLEDGTFFICFTSPDGKMIRIGPYDRRFCIESKYLHSFKFGYVKIPYVPMVSVYYLSNNAAITSYRLSLDTKFYRRIVPYSRSPILVDFDNRTFLLTANGKLVQTNFPEAEMQQILRRRSLWAKL